jgi:hypothetical protein
MKSCVIYIVSVFVITESYGENKWTVLDEIYGTTIAHTNDETWIVSFNQTGSVVLIEHNQGKLKVFNRYSLPQPAGYPTRLVSHAAGAYLEMLQGSFNSLMCSAELSIIDLTNSFSEIRRNARLLGAVDGGLLISDTANGICLLHENAIETVVAADRYFLEFTCGWSIDVIDFFLPISDTSYMTGVTYLGDIQ